MKETKDPVAKAIIMVALQIRILGNADAGTNHMGGTEWIGSAIKEGARMIAESIKKASEES